MRAGKGGKGYINHLCTIYKLDEVIIATLDVYMFILSLISVSLKGLIGSMVTLVKYWYVRNQQFREKIKLVKLKSDEAKRRIQAFLEVVIGPLIEQAISQNLIGHSILIKRCNNITEEGEKLYS
jgi:hypothetical protein